MHINISILDINNLKHYELLYMQSIRTAHARIPAAISIFDGPGHKMPAAVASVIVCSYKLDDEPLN